MLPACAGVILSCHVFSPFKFHAPRMRGGDPQKYAENLLLY